MPVWIEAIPQLCMSLMVPVYSLLKRVAVVTLVGLRGIRRKTRLRSPISLAFL
jgi:hypothetical protein